MAVSAIAAGGLSGASAAVLGQAQVAAIVHDLRGCMSRLPASDVHVLVLATGLGGHRKPTGPTLARWLHRSPAAVSQAETLAATRLQAVQQHRHCARGPVAAPAATPVSKPKPATAGATSAPAATAPAATPPGTAAQRGAAGSAAVSSTSPRWTSPSVLIALAVALAALGFVGVQFARLRDRPRPRYGYSWPRRPPQA